MKATRHGRGTRPLLVVGVFCTAVFAVMVITCGMGQMVRAWLSPRKTSEKTAVSLPFDLVGEVSKSQASIDDELVELPPIKTGLTKEHGQFVLASGTIADWKLLGPAAKMAVSRFACHRMYPGKDAIFVRERSGNMQIMLDNIAVQGLNDDEKIAEILALFYALEKSMAEQESKKK